MSLFFVLGSNAITNAQGRGNEGYNQKQERKAEKQRIKAERQQAEYERQRQAAWTYRNTQISTDYDRRNRNYRPNNNVIVTSNRYRVYRNGSYYNTDQRGVDLLRQAVNEGYRQGFAAGRSDTNNRRRSSWSNSTVYRNGTMGYESYVNRSQYQYYFQQGFQRGYQDGSNQRYQNGYEGNYQYGYRNNGTLSVIGAILEQVLNISSY